MSTVYDVPAWKLIVEVAEILKKDHPEVTPPQYSQFWKTGIFKERARKGQTGGGFDARLYLEKYI